MAFELRVPELGESVVEATVAEWLKSEGDAVQVGEAVVRLETDKVDVEVSAEQAGVLAQILRQNGADVRAGETLGRIEPAGEAAAQAPEPQPASATGEASVPAKRQPASAAGEESTPVEQQPVSREDKISPLARRVADEMRIDVTQVPPGPTGRVTREDVEGFANQRKQEPPAAPTPTAQPTEPPAAAVPRDEGAPEAKASQPAQAAPLSRPAAPAQAAPAGPLPAAIARPEERIRFSRRRQTIARRLVEAQQTAAMLTTFNEVDMSAVIDLRTKHKESFKERQGVGLGFMSFFVKASIGALKAFPQVNAELQGDELVLKRYYDIGIAIGADEGLVVPVLRDADRMTFAQIEKGIEALVQKTRDGALTVEDLRGGTFTITNGGIFGSLLSTPILNPPQVAILGMHKIEPRPIALEGSVVIRPMMYVALSYDHRVIDGREAVQFLVRVKTLIEDPETLLLEG